MLNQSQPLPTDQATPPSSLERIRPFRVWILTFALLVLLGILSFFVYYRNRFVPPPLPEGGHVGIVRGPEDMLPTEPQLYSREPAPLVDQMPRKAPLPLAKGKQTYFVRNGDKPGPKITLVEISDLDSKNRPYIFDVTIESPTAPVGKVTVTIITDSKKEPHSLELKQGELTKGTWSGTWSLTDTYTANYQAEIRAVSSEGESIVTLTFR